MSKVKKIAAVATIIMKIDGKRVPIGQPFYIDPEELKGMPFASEYDGKMDDPVSDTEALEPTQAELEAAAEERAALIKVAVAEAMDADPDRETQPTIKTVEAILEFKGVKADEITVAYEAIKAETPSNDNDGDNPGDNNT